MRGGVRGMLLLIEREMRGWRVGVGVGVEVGVGVRGKV